MVLKFLELFIFFNCALQSPATSAKKISITDEDGNPIANANVQIDFLKNSQFIHLITNEIGIVEVQETPLGALQLRVDKPGFSSLNINLKNLHDLSDITLSPKQFPENKTYYQGITNGYSNLKTDGWLDFSLVIPAYDRKNLVLFNFDNFISPTQDHISVLGYDFLLPSNISIPLQYEKYFFDFIINKPEFSIPLLSQKAEPAYALHGKFPINTTIEQFKANTHFFDLVNNINFVGIDIKKISPLKETAFTVAKTLLSKKVILNPRDIPPDKIILTFSGFKKNNFYYLTDLKKLDSKMPTSLFTILQSPTYLISMLVNSPKAELSERSGLFMIEVSDKKKIYDFNQVSYQISKKSTGDQFSHFFLDMIEKPKLIKDNLTVKPPLIPKNLIPYGMVVSLYRSTKSIESLTYSNKELIYSATYPQWQESINLKGLNFGLEKKSKYVWEVLFFASGKEKLTHNINWENVSHVTRNSMEFIY